MPRVTSRDVAREAGVSQTTVSFVLNNRPDQTIPEHTRTAVHAAAAKLGYVPSAAARSLKRGHSNVVLCVLPDAPVSDAFQQFNRSLSQALGVFDYTCVFLHTDNSATPLAAMWQHVHPAIVAAFAPLTDADAAALRRAGIALLDGVFEPDNSDITGLDQHEVGRLQIEHLVSHGHRRIGYGAVADPREHAFCAPRLQGAQAACREHGLPDPVVAQLDYSIDAARVAIEQWRRPAAAVTAVAAFNDVAGLSLLAACRDSGIEVPADLAVIGVDDIAASSLAAPALSTVSMNLQVPADTLAARILQAAGVDTKHRDRDPATEILEIVERESTATQR